MSSRSVLSEKKGMDWNEMVPIAQRKNEYFYYAIR
jgi:hypothetical protein